MTLRSKTEVGLGCFDDQKSVFFENSGDSKFVTFPTQTQEFCDFMWKGQGRGRQEIFQTGITLQLVLMKIGQGPYFAKNWGGVWVKLK